jgi:DNA (cytosine-5)-methyltransferase 1
VSLTGPVFAGLTYVDLFCGFGGSSIGLAAAGWELKLAANHWDRAIETHSANFPDAEHWQVDISKVDKRRLPAALLLWASPICTELSPAGRRGGGKAKQKRTPGQMALEVEGHVPSAAYERTRASFWDVIEAATVHRYPAVIVENVVEAASWELFEIWLMGMEHLGYNIQFVSVSAAHVGDDGNDPAPQWRDRLYIVATLKGIPLPDVTPKPLAHCFDCAEDVRAVQTWKKPTARPIGKYGVRNGQYYYRCPNSRCKHAIVEPYVLPALAALDLTDLGQRIGDRAKQLAAATMRRIRYGVAQFGQPAIVAAGGNTYERPGPGYHRAWPAGESPLAARTGTPGDALSCPPFLLDRYDYAGPDAGRVRPVAEPMTAVTAAGRTVRTLVTPPAMVSVNHSDGDRRGYLADERPLPTRSTKLGDGVLSPPLIVPAGGTWNDTAASALDPMRTRTTRDTDGVFLPGHLVGELRRNSTGRPAEDGPLQTVTAGGNHHYLTTLPGAFIQKHHGGTDCAGIAHMTKPVTDPLAAVVARPNLSLVIPYRRGDQPYPAGAEPLTTVATREQHGLLAVESIDVDNCHFRMLKPREHGRAQRFPDAYVVHGNKGEQTQGFGNAVAANVAQWLGYEVSLVFGGAA